MTTDYLFAIAVTAVLGFVNLVALWRLREPAHANDRALVWWVVMLFFGLLCGLYAVAVVSYVQQRVDFAVGYFLWGSLLNAAGMAVMFSYAHDSARRLAVAMRSREESHRALERERNRLESMVTERTVGLENALSDAVTSRQQATEAARKLREELQFAAHLQNTLLRVDEMPSYCQVRTLFQPGGAVSGDFLRVQYFPESDHVRAVVADAMGHNISAAFISLIAASGLDHTDPELAPCYILEALNEAFVSYDTHLYVTAEIVHLNAAGEVQMSNAGHPQPLLLPAQGVPRVVGAAGGFALGMFGDAGIEFDLDRLRLEPRDRLIIYSDALTERRLADGTVLNADWWLAELSARRTPASIDELRALIERRLHESEPLGATDDLTVVILEYRPPAN